MTTQTAIVIPMAGLGQRFVDAGYETIKPLLPIKTVSNKDYPMVVAATMPLYPSLPAVTPIHFVVRDHTDFDGCEKEIKQFFPQAKFLSLSKLTEGQAITALKAVNNCNPEQPVLIGACDNGMLYSEDELKQKMQEFDAIVWTFKGHSSVLENPNGYGWVKCNQQGIVEYVSVKKSISDNPLSDHAIVGAFWFKSADLYAQATARLVEQNDRINNEFYIDSVLNHVIELGKRVTVLKVERYFCWGTPQQYEDYQKTASYWQAFKDDILLNQ